MDNRRFLKIKIKSLAAEARIIRQEERKTFGQLRNDLHQHRVGVVRREARTALLAYGYIRLRSYRDLEKNPATSPSWEGVERLVRKFGLKDFDHSWYEEQGNYQTGKAA